MRLSWLMRSPAAPVRRAANAAFLLESVTAATVLSDFQTLHSCRVRSGGVTPAM